MGVDIWDAEMERKIVREEDVEKNKMNKRKL